ncbi:MAG: hypothetical protein WD397_16795 [Wenzhouxiangellaceae bacterium]
MFENILRLPFAVALLPCLTLIAAGPLLAQVDDPTRPPTASELAAWHGQPAAEAVQWQLQSVLISGQRRVAIINGKRAIVGQLIDGARVRAIEPTHAIIQTDTDTLTLSIRRYGLDGRNPK